MMPSAAEHQCNLKLCSPDLCQHWVLPQAPPLRGGFISGPLIFCPALPPPEQTWLWGHSVTMNPTLCGSREFAGWWWAHLSVFIWRKGFCKTLFSLKVQYLSNFNKRMWGNKSFDVMWPTRPLTPKQPRCKYSLTGERKYMHFRFWGELPLLYPLCIYCSFIYFIQRSRVLLNCNWI